MPRIAVLASATFLCILFFQNCGFRATDSSDGGSSLPQRESIENGGEERAVSYAQEAESIESIVDSVASSNTIEEQSDSSSCGGVSVGGFCWYLGAYGQSCSEVCSSRGGYHQATESFAGSGGSHRNCVDVVAALTNQNSPTVANGTGGPAAGCTYADDPTPAQVGFFWFNTSATSASFSHALAKRVCSCQK